VFAPATALATATTFTPAEISLSPNPASPGDEVRVALPVAVGLSATVQVLNILGQAVRPTCPPALSGWAGLGHGANGRAGAGRVHAALRGG
jgi:hypothetical protein